MKIEGSGLSSRSFLYLLALLYWTVFFIVGTAKTSVADDNEQLCAKDVGVVSVRIAATGLGSILNKLKIAKDRIPLIRDFIDPVRFYTDKSGYFYVYNYQCVNIAHATQKDLQGKNLYDYKDSRGKFVIRELSAAAQKGGGFVEYYWVKPGEKGEKKKLGYVEPIPGTDYFIGTGIYLGE